MSTYIYIYVYMYLIYMAQGTFKKTRPKLIAIEPKLIAIP